MPYILYTLGATAQENCLLSTVHIEGIWARLRVARTYYARIPKSFTYVSHSFAFPFGQRPKGWGDKPNGAEARSSGKINLPSSQAALMLRAAVATDAFTPRRHNAHILFVRELRERMLWVKIFISLNINHLRHWKTKRNQKKPIDGTAAKHL